MAIARTSAGKIAISHSSGRERFHNVLAVACREDKLPVLTYPTDSGYEPSAAAHAAYGNLHFVMIARLSEGASCQQYDGFMRECMSSFIYALEEATRLSQ
jgi:hypothetical protein